MSPLESRRSRKDCDCNKRLLVEFIKIREAIESGYCNRELLLTNIMEGIEKMAITLDQLLEKVAEQDTRLDSVRELIVGLRQQLKDALANANLSPANQAKVEKIFADLEKNSAEIDEAITDNTEPPVPPVV